MSRNGYLRKYKQLKIILKTFIFSLSHKKLLTSQHDFGIKNNRKKILTEKLSVLFISYE